jgi:nucleoside-diphosphate-sugar epimerase
MELRAAMRTLPISVCRLSTVVGDSTTGAIARPGAIHHAVRLMYAGLAAMIPGREDSPVDILASDYAARAVATLTTAAFEPGRTWHICAGADTIPAGELLDLTLDTFARARPAWRKRTIERPAMVPLETFELFCRSAEQAGNATLAAAVTMIGAFAPQLAYPKRFDTRRSAAALSPHGIDAPPARDTWTRMIEHVAGATM